MKVTDSGELIENNEISMMCEHKNCRKTKGKDYVRKQKIVGWKDEPIFLCEEHSVGFKEYKLII